MENNAHSKPAAGRSIASVEHALTALTLLAARPYLGVTEMAQALSISPSSAHRLLGTLCSNGFAVQDSHRKYRLGQAAAGLHARPTRETIRQMLHRHLAALAAQVRETAHLVVLDGANVRFLDSVETDRVLRVSSRAGMVLAAHRTSGGKALLADLSDSEVDSRHPAGLTDATRAVSSLEGLHRELARVRRGGYGINIEESEAGIIAVGACVRAVSGTAVAALSVSVPTVRLSRRTIRPLAEIVVAAVETARGAV